MPRADKMEPPPDMSSRGSECESRDLPELPVLSCGGSYSNVVDSSMPADARHGFMGYGFAKNLDSTNSRDI